MRNLHVRVQHKYGKESINLLTELIVALLQYVVGLTLPLGLSGVILSSEDLRDNC